MEDLIMFIQDNKKKIIAILIVLVILIIIVINNNKNKDIANNEETNYAPVVEMSEDEIQRQKDLELRGGDPWALPNENLILNENTEIITEVY